MTISPISGRSSLNMGQKIDRPIRFEAPPGIASAPDRLEPASPEQQGPPSLFKKFLFEPIIYGIKWAFRMLFRFIDWFRGVVSDERGLGESTERHEMRKFLQNLHSAPLPQELLLYFERVFSIEEKNQIYCFLGEHQLDKKSWKEWVWKRSVQKNIDLGQTAVQNNPDLIRSMLAERLAQVVSRSLH